MSEEGRVEGLGVPFQEEYQKVDLLPTVLHQVCEEKWSERKRGMGGGKEREGEEKRLIK